MKKNGFTLIEILGVITLLALLSVVVLMVTDNSLKKSKKTLSDAQISNIKSAASMWRTDNIEMIPDDGYYTLTLGELIDSGYISDVIDPNTNHSFNRNLIVKVNVNDILVDEESSIDDVIDANINSEVELIKANINNGIMDGIYYYNNSGNLERNASRIYLSRNWNKPRGNILVHNHQFISGCISIGSNNYDYYKGVVTKLNYSCSTNRGDNLFVNGDLSFGNNTNFSSFTYNSEGYLSYTTSTAPRITSSFYIPVDIEKKYELGVTVKNNVPSTKGYMGFEAYDIDHNLMIAPHYISVANTLTTLARDLKNGDTYIYLTDMTNWDVNTTQTYRRGFIFWNYKDSTGYTYPELTYSRNVWSNLYDNNTSEVTDNIQRNVEIDGEVVNRIKLKAAWNKGTFVAGTKLSQSNDGSQHPYALLNNSTLSSEWTTKTAVIQGIGTSVDLKKFRHGQRYLRFMTMPNSSKLADVTTYYKDFYLREVVE